MMYYNPIFVGISRYNRNCRFQLQKPAELKACVKRFIFGSSLSKLHHCWTCVTDFRKGAFLVSPHL